jgi:CheY-like chemotaxis protein
MKSTTTPPVIARGPALVIDDNETVRQVTARLLQTLGFEAWQACDGRDALDQFAGRVAELQLVLVDLSMPRLGGEETVRGWRHLRPDLPVIMMSGFTESEMGERFADLGVSAFLQKPFTRRDLGTKVQAVLAPKEN